MAKISVMFGSELQSEHTLEVDEHKIGRAADCEIVVDNMGVSRHHCSIVKDGDQWKLVDKGSNNGTFVDGQRINEQILQDRDRVVLGKHNLVFDAYGYASSEVKKQAAGMGSEMTMFVDPEQMAKMQAELKSSGGIMALTIMQGGREIRCQLTKEETVIGKGVMADIPIKGMFVKPAQAKVVRSDAGYRLLSLGGLRSVRVNGSKISQAMLTEGDTITIAGQNLSFKKQ